MKEQLVEETETSDKSFKTEKLKELIRKNFINNEIEVQLKYLRA